MPSIQKAIFTDTKQTIKKKILLIPSCPNRIFAGQKKQLKYSNQTILESLGFDVSYPKNLNNQCCGQMYHSQANFEQQKRSLDLLQKSIDFNKYDYVTIDNSSCASFAKDQGVNLININSIILSKLNNLNLVKKFKKIALHIDCSTRKQNINQKYIHALSRCCDEVVVPERIYCCGFAGDKGFTTPELNAASLNSLKAQIKDCDIGVTFNRSCQIGLSYYGKVEYIPFPELLLKCLE